MPRTPAAPGPDDVPTVDQALAVIEGTNTIADLLEGMRDALRHRGWSDHNAEIAAIEFYRIERTR